MTQTIEMITQEEFKNILKKDNMGEKVNQALQSLRDVYHIDNHTRQYKIDKSEYTEVGEVSQLQNYAKNDCTGDLKPIEVKDPRYGGDIYLMTFLEIPKDSEEINKITLGIGLHQKKNWFEPYDKRLDRLTEEIAGISGKWNWADGEIYIEKKWIKERPASLYYNGIDRFNFPVFYCTRGIAYNLYQQVLSHLDQKEGSVSYRYSNYHTPKIVDHGATRIPFIFF